MGSENSARILASTLHHRRGNIEKTLREKRKKQMRRHINKKKQITTDKREKMNEDQWKVGRLDYNTVNNWSSSETRPSSLT